MAYQGSPEIHYKISTKTVAFSKCPEMVKCGALSIVEVLPVFVNYFSGKSWATWETMEKFNLFSLLSS